MTTLLWIGTLLLGVQAGGQTTVGPLGDPARWELRGVKSFAPREVLGAVLGLGELRVAARAGSDRAKFLRLVETSSACGYPGQAGALALHASSDEGFIHADIDRGTAAVRLHGEGQPHLGWRVALDINSATAASRPASTSSRPQGRDLTALLSFRTPPSRVSVWPATQSRQWQARSSYAEGLEEERHCRLDDTRPLEPVHERLRVLDR